MDANEKRPWGALSEAVGPDPIVPETSATVGGSTDAAAVFRDCYAVLVRGRTVRRHLYFNLPAATRTVQRALERGDRAELVLVKLVPVDSRHLDRGAAQ